MNQLPIWVIYKNPLDYPNKFVARKWLTDIPTQTLHTADTLEEIRKQIPTGLVNINRQPSDDPTIVEVWI